MINDAVWVKKRRGGAMHAGWIQLCRPQLILVVACSVVLGPTQVLGLPGECHTPSPYIV